MNDAGDPRARGGRHVEGEIHERRGGRPLKILRGVLFENARAKRPPRLAFLDVAVDPVANRNRARIGDDAAPSQRARTDLHASFEPTDDLSALDRLGDDAREVGRSFPAGAPAPPSNPHPCVNEPGTLIRIANWREPDAI